jgi:hypothetical protein
MKEINGKQQSALIAIMINKINIPKTDWYLTANAPK